MNVTLRQEFGLEGGLRRQKVFAVGSMLMRASRTQVHPLPAWSALYEQYPDEAKKALIEEEKVIWVSYASELA